MLLVYMKNLNAANFPQVRTKIFGRDISRV